MKRILVVAALIVLVIIVVVALQKKEKGPRVPGKAPAEARTEPAAPAPSAASETKTEDAKPLPVADAPGRTPEGESMQPDVPVVTATSPLSGIAVPPKVEWQAPVAEWVSAAGGRTELQAPSGEFVKGEDGVMRVNLVAENTVAMVNGSPVVASELALFGAGNENKPRTLTADEYRAALDAAINRKVTERTAINEGIRWTAAMTEDLERMRQEILGLIQASGRTGDTWGTTEEQEAFAMAEARALVLQNAMLEREGKNPPALTEEQIRIYYAEHAAEFPPLPESQEPAVQGPAWAEISASIRAKAEPALMTAWEAARAELLRKLRADMQIEATVKPAQVPDPMLPGGINPAAETVAP